MRAYHTIMEGYTWEGFEEEIYQHLRGCMDHVEMEEIRNSLGDLTLPPLFSWRMRGDSSMSHSICMGKAYGKDIVWLHNDLYNEYVHSLTIYVQVIAPRRSILPYRLHGQKHHSGCTSKAPNISHHFRICEKTWEASKWWGNHLPHHYLMQSGDVLRLQQDDELSGKESPSLSGPASYFWRKVYF